MGQTGLFCLFLSFSQNNDKYSTIWKKCRWCAWDLNPGTQDGRHRQIHWAMAASFLWSCTITFGITTYSFLDYLLWLPIGVVLGQPWAWLRDAPDPINITYLDDQKPNRGLSGYCIDLLVKLATMMDFDYEIVPSSRNKVCISSGGHELRYSKICLSYQLEMKMWPWIRPWTFTPWPRFLLFTVRPQVGERELDGHRRRPHFRRDRHLRGDVDHDHWERRGGQDDYLDNHWVGLRGWNPPKNLLPLQYHLRAKFRQDLSRSSDFYREQTSTRKHCPLYVRFSKYFIDKCDY